MGVGFLGEVTSPSVRAWTKAINVIKLDVSVHFKLDAGADVSIIPSTLCRCAMPCFVAPGNTEIPVFGCFDAKLTVSDSDHSETCMLLTKTELYLVVSHVLH